MFTAESRYSTPARGDGNMSDGGPVYREKEGQRRREGKEEAVAMKREKDNKFIIINEDEISHAGMFAT